MRVLVIGGTQFNGLALVWHLVECGHDVTVLNRGKTKANLPEGVKRLTADRTQKAALKKVLGNEEFDCVQDMCAYHPKDAEIMLELLNGRVSHYIFASSTAIYKAAQILPITEKHPVDRGKSQIEYGMHKILCEDLLFKAYKEHSFPATVAAFSMVFGPRNIIPDREQRMIARILSGRPVLIPGDGTTLGQVGSVRDQARALEMMMCDPQTFGERYNLTGKDYYSDLGYVQAFSKALGKKPQLVHIPAELMDDLWDGKILINPGAKTTQVNVDIRSTEKARKSQAKATMRFKLATIIQRLSPNIHRWNQSTIFSIDKLRKDTGFVPEYDLKKMVKEVYDWQKRESINQKFNWVLDDQILELLKERAA